MTRRNSDQKRAYYYAESEEVITSHRARECDMPCSCVRRYGNLRRKYLEQRDDLEPEEIEQIIDSLMADEYRLDRAKPDWIYRAHPLNPLKKYGLPGGIQPYVEDFVRELLPGEELLINDRSQIAPYELDLWLPGRHIAIEVNEDGWHGPMLADPHAYHAKKIELAEAAGISLVFVWESQWRQGRTQIEADLKCFVESGGAVVSKSLRRLESEYVSPECDKDVAVWIRDRHRSGVCGRRGCECVAHYERLRQRYLAATSL